MTASTTDKPKTEAKPKAKPAAKADPEVTKLKTRVTQLENEIDRIKRSLGGALGIHV